MKRNPRKVAKIAKVLAGILAIIGLLLGSSGCSTTSVEPDRSGVEYDAGPMSATKFDSCVKPGNRDWRGPGDQFFTYPQGQRSYEFSRAKSADAPQLEIVSKDNLTMTVSGVATFSLNTTCKVLRQFHERLGLKYKAYEEGGWAKLLETYLRQPLDRAMDVAAKSYNWMDLYSNPAIKRQWEAQVGKAVVEQVNTTAGGPYFCAPNYAGVGDCGAFALTLQQPSPPENVVKALASAQEARELGVAQKQRNTQVNTELDSIRALVKVLGPQGYVLYQAIKDGRVSVVPVPAGGSINVNTK